MRSTHSLSGVIAAAVLAAGLALGTASAASAAPRPVVFPTCSTLLPARDFATGGLMSGWTLYTAPPFAVAPVGASDAGIAAIIRSRTPVSCTWTPGTLTPGTKLAVAASISEVTLTATDLKSLRRYYAAIGAVGVSHGGPAFSYTFVPAGHPGWIERHTVFPGGTVVFTLDRSGTVNGAMSQDADDVLIGLNPGINS
jgi:hypothetical protein